jgi:hypothetical protein
MQHHSAHLADLALDDGMVVPADDSSNTAHDFDSKLSAVSYQLS